MITIEYSGVRFTYENDEDFEDILKMKCKCGHTVGQHAHSVLWSIKVFLVSQCVSCGFKDNKLVCEKFIWNGEYPYYEK